MFVVFGEYSVLYNKGLVNKYEGGGGGWGRGGAIGKVVARKFVTHPFLLVQN